MTEIQAKQAVALLRYLRAYFSDHTEQARRIDSLLTVIDAWEQELALTRVLHAEVVTEATGLDPREYWVVAATEVEYSAPYGYEREILKGGTRVWLARWTEDQLEAARREAEELHKKLHPASDNNPIPAPIITLPKD
jgi:hypothetical protein